MNRKALLITLSLFAAILLSSQAFADIQLDQNGTRKGQFRKLNLKNGVTINDAGDITFAALQMSGGTIDNTVIGGTTPAAGTFTNSVVTQYMQLAYFSKLTRPGSGATKGSMILLGSSSNQDCGVNGSGTTLAVCVSNGTDWIAI